MSDKPIVSAAVANVINVMTEEKKAKIRATWAKKKELRLKYEAEHKQKLESLDVMQKIHAHTLEQDKVKRKWKPEAKTTTLTSENDLKTAAVATLLLQIKEAREDPIKFVEFVIRDPSGQPLVLKQFHKDWLSTFHDKDRVVVEASRNHGKCVSSDTYVELANGKRLFAKQLPKNFEVLAYDLKQEIFVLKNGSVADNGIKVTVEIRTEQSNSVRVTEEHPFLTPRGWIDAQDLTCGDLVAIKRNSKRVWERIEFIGNKFPEQTWAIEVEDLQNFIANDFITHNTTILIGYCLWRIGRNPNIRIKLFSQNDARAKERLFELAANIENNEMFKLVFPDIKPKKGAWSNVRVVVERTATLKDATFEALGITTSATGGRADLVVLDDVCDLNNSVIYPTLRERIIQKFTGELIPMMDPGGQIISIATPYHVSDLNAVLKTNKEFTHLRHVVGNDADPLAPLWPERWPREALQSLRVQQGPIEFDRAYRCIAFSSDMVPCKPEWIHFYNRELLGDPRKMICVQAYDLALEQKTTADYFAWVTVLYDMERGLAFVADAGHDRMSFSSQGHKIIANYHRWNPDRIVIEKVGLGGSLENYLEENSPIKLPLVPFKPKGDKYFRFTQQSPWLEDGKVTFHPNMDPVKNVLSDEDGNLIKELLEFPVSRHDDLTDAFVMCMWSLEEFRNHEAELGWFVGGGMNAKLSVVG